MRKITLLVCFMLVAYLPGQAQLFNPPQSNQDVVHVVSSFTATNTPNPVAVNRSFIVHFPNPAGSTQNLGLPVVFVYHGRGMTASPLQSQTEQAADRGPDMQGYTKFDVIANRDKFIVIYPVSLNKNWADGRDNPSDNQGVDDFDFFDKMLAFMQVNYQIDTSRVYACGMSNGGFMSQALGVKRGNKLAAIGVVAATMGSSLAANFAPQRQLPVAMICGTNDIIVPYDGPYQEFTGAEEARNLWLQYNVCSNPVEPLRIDGNKLDMSTVDLFSYNDCGDDAELLFYRVNRGGHTWPGAAPSGLGTTNRDINASEELWKFFNRHQLQHSSAPILSTNTLVALTDDKIMAYPNPANDFLLVKQVERDVHYTLFDARGQEIAIKVSANSLNELNINLSHLPKGLYYLKTNNGKQLRFYKD